MVTSSSTERGAEGQIQTWGCVGEVLASRLSPGAGLDAAAPAVCEDIPKFAGWDAAQSWDSVVLEWHNSGCFHISQELSNSWLVLSHF